jgi:hypothetical protein
MEIHGPYPIFTDSESPINNYHTGELGKNNFTLVLNQDDLITKK